MKTFHFELVFHRGNIQFVMELVKSLSVFCFFLLSAILYIGFVKSASIKKDVVQKCQEIPKIVLAHVLGSAFNPRYMSINIPFIDNNKYIDDSNKRKVNAYLPFYVGDDLVTEDKSDDVPAWNVDFGVENLHRSDLLSGTVRKKRVANIKPGGPHWKCESEVKWIDLGVDYFPRFLRTVECTTSDCWYGRYKCRPRAFTVRLLKRRSDKCDESEISYKSGVSGLPDELRELWVWEERAVNFCCDCAI
ncbi:protein trunk [Agrilus planipennis]|uniref:Protein trunk n=1 Tax=Agrilus planipennis TaxID=224129 RepID=A0A1W4WWI6_AGRPL|nr:protein trunk [Agrilus planipennis]